MARAHGQVQTFFDELKNGTPNYRTVASLDSQIAQEYRGRCILELLQNAHDALANAEPDDPRRISFALTTTPEPVLLIGNSGRPFRSKDFYGICQLGQSPKDPNESVGNKGLGFRSVLEVSTCPEIWSTAPAGSDTSFVFRFDPSVSDQVATVAQKLEEQGLNARSPFDPERLLVDWSQEQMNHYHKSLSGAGLDGAAEARKFLSPYLFPLPIVGIQPEVEKLLSSEYTTVVRLRLDGGRTGTCDEAVQSAKDQLQDLDARSTIFLPNLSTLVIDIDGVRRTLERIVDSNLEFSGYRRTRLQRLLIGRSGSAVDDNTTSQFHVWTRDIGGDEDPEQAERIRTVVKHLPNRWPEVRRVTVGVAVKDASAPEEGIFVIFLPTEIKTGTGAHINAPFYGSLGRRQIDFNDAYNNLLLKNVLDLCLDVATGLVSEEPKGWRARAVIDLLSSTAAVDGKAWQLMDGLHKRASKQDRALNNQALVSCDGGWRVPGKARMMPDIPGDNPISAEQWREHTEFAVVATVLDGRRAAVEALIKKLDGSLSPTHCEWRRTIERVATNVQAREIDVTWDAFLNGLIAVLPADLKSEPRRSAPDPLATARFLPTQDRHLLRASGPVKLFFQPVRGADAAAELVGEVPGTPQQRVAFLHRDIRTQEGPRRRNTGVQKFLDGRFARQFRREEILRDVVIDALPRLPAPFGIPEADLCAELFTWTLKLLGEDELESLLPLLKRLPVACHGGWRAMSDAVFGPGWPDRLGDDVWSLANELPENTAMRLCETTLLSPRDSRWGTAVEEGNELFARAGVVDGLRLTNDAPEAHFHMISGSYALPDAPPTGTPQAAWDAWRKTTREEARPPFHGRFEYSLSGIQLLPEIHYLKSFSRSGRSALSRLVLASLGRWPAGWKSATIRKVGGRHWLQFVTSPLKYWLTSLAWLNDRSNVEQPLVRRWLVPAFLLRGQPDRFRHLDPLSVNLARKLEVEPELKATLTELGLNVYPVEEDRTGPELLDTLAAAWTANRVPPRRFDVFLGQVRHAWGHLDPDKELPETFLVRTGRRSFSTRGQDKMSDIYLPDSRDRTRSLHEHDKRILEMHAADATRMAEALLAATDIRRASTLEERFLIDGSRWTDGADGIRPLDETRYAWLPVPLLAIAAHGGAHPAGPETIAWQEATNRLRRARVLECEAITVQLVDDNQIIASSGPEAQWLPDDVLAIRRDTGLSYENLASAAQAMLGRQDLLKDLRLVLGALADHEKPTPEQIEAAMELARIDHR